MSGFEQGPGEASEFTKRSNRMIECLWLEICRSHLDYRTLIGVIAPAVIVDSFEVEICPIGNTHPVRALLPRLAPGLEDIIDAPHHPRIVKLLYVETTGQMRFLRRPVLDGAVFRS